MANSDYGSDVELDGEDAINALIVALDANPISAQNLRLENLVDEYDAQSLCVAHVPHSLQGSTSTTYVAAREHLSSREGSSVGKSEPPADRTIQLGGPKVEWDEVETRKTSCIITTKTS